MYSLNAVVDKKKKKKKLTLDLNSWLSKQWSVYQSVTKPYPTLYSVIRESIDLAIWVLFFLSPKEYQDIAISFWNTEFIIPANLDEQN